MQVKYENSETATVSAAMLEVDISITQNRTNYGMNWSACTFSFVAHNTLTVDVVSGCEHGNSRLRQFSYPLISPRCVLLSA